MKSVVLLTHPTPRLCRVLVIIYDNFQNQQLRWQRFLPIVVLLKYQRAENRGAALVHAIIRCSFCLVGPHLLSRLLHLFSHVLHLTFIYSLALHFLTLPMSSPSTPVWYLRKLSYEAQDRRDLVRSIWRALAEVNDIISQELARIQSTGIIAVIVSWVFRRRGVFYFLYWPLIHSSTFHDSKTEHEPHWTSRVFASTPNGGSVYLGGLHSFSSNSLSVATFRPRRQDNRKSYWRRRTLSDFPNSKVRKLKITDI